MPIYLDYCATTPVSKEVLKEMLPYFSEHYYNPSSIYKGAQKTSSEIRKARRQIAENFSCLSEELIFTSGGTESNNIAIRGIALANKLAGKGNHIITTCAEHLAVLNTVEDLCKNYGFTSTILPIDQFGMVHCQDLEKAIQSDTVLISCIYVSSEVGTIQPIFELGEIAQKYNIPFHTDAVQALGSISIDCKQLPVDSFSVSGHKIHGPKGIGILYLKKNTPFLSQQSGGSQEFKYRAGTENIPAIIGFKKAIEYVPYANSQKLIHYRDMLIEGIVTKIPNSFLTGHPSKRIPYHTSFVFEGIDSNTLLMHLDISDIGASSGSACSVGNPEASPLLLAMKFSEELAHGALRMSFGKDISEEKINQVIQNISNIIQLLRNR